ncbi:hypothetical protein D3C85_1220180 [compost metagenome]
MHWVINQFASCEPCVDAFTFFGLDESQLVETAWVVIRTDVEVVGGLVTFESFARHCLQTLQQLLESFHRVDLVVVIEFVILCHCVSPAGL